MYVCVYKYAHTHIYTYISTCACACIYLHMYIHVHIYTCICTIYLHTNIYIYSCTHINKYMYIYLHTYIHIYIRIHTYLFAALYGLYEKSPVHNLIGLFSNIYVSFTDLLCEKSPVHKMQSFTRADWTQWRAKLCILCTGLISHKRSAKETYMFEKRPIKFKRNDARSSAFCTALF